MKLPGDGITAWDTESTGLNRWTGCRPFAVSMADRSGRVRWWEWSVDPMTRRPAVDPDDAREIRSLLAASTRRRFFNGVFDILMLESVGIGVGPGPVDEVQWMFKAIDNLRFEFGLKSLAKQYAKIPVDDEAALHEAVLRSRRAVRAGKLGWSLAEETEADYWLPRALWEREPELAARFKVDPAACRRYGKLDATRTLVLGDIGEYGMDDLGVRAVYDRELELMPLTIDMQRLGVTIDPDRMADLRAECERRRDEAAARMAHAWRNAWACEDENRGMSFNPASTKQVGQLLFGGKPLSLPVMKRTKTGQPKTDAEAVSPHMQGVPLVRDLLSCRANGQAVKLFFDKYAALAEPLAGTKLLLMHPGFDQWGALTARYTCTNPNLQQVSDPDTTNSIAREFVVDVRQVFVPPPGHSWYCPDYSQIEVVIFAGVSGEPTMIEALRRGDDVHAATADKIWGGEGNPRALEAAMELLATRDQGRARAVLDEYGWKITEVEKSVDKKIFRKKSKSVTFTKIFGGGPLALMRWIGVARQEAVRILHAYDESFPTLVQCMRDIEAEGLENGYVTNLFGRRLSVDRFNAYRCVNHLVQSSAADLLKRGMLACYRWLKSIGSRCRIAMTIHDELIFQVPTRDVTLTLLRGIRDRMAEHGGALPIPVKVDMDRVVGRWSEKARVAL